MWQGRGSRLWRRRAMALGTTVLLGWAMLPRAPVVVRHAQLFPTIQPDVLAHYLADFSNHALLYTHPESWAIESEWSNFTSWQYEVSYLCGQRCAGRMAITAYSAHKSDTPQHGAAHRHRLLAIDVHCTRLLPVLTWPSLCEETQTETLIAGEAEGSRLTENAFARCSPLAMLLVKCASAAELDARHQLRLRSLSTALAPHE